MCSSVISQWQSLWRLCLITAPSLVMLCPFAEIRLFHGCRKIEDSQVVLFEIENDWSSISVWKDLEAGKTKSKM